MMSTPRQDAGGRGAARVGPDGAGDDALVLHLSSASCGASCALAVLASVGGLCDVSLGPRVKLCAQPPGSRPVLFGGELRSAVGDLLGRHA